MAEASFGLSSQGRQGEGGGEKAEGRGGERMQKGGEGRGWLRPSGGWAGVTVSPGSESTTLPQFPHLEPKESREHAYLVLAQRLWSDPRADLREKAPVAAGCSASALVSPLCSRFPRPEWHKGKGGASSGVQQSGSSQLRPREAQAGPFLAPGLRCPPRGAGDPGLRHPSQPVQTCSASGCDLCRARARPSGPTAEAGRPSPCHPPSTDRSE